MNVLLVHTAPVFVVSNYGSTNISRETNVPGIKQDLTEYQIHDIGKMLSDKYGKPRNKMKFKYIEFFVIERTQIQKYLPDTSNMGELIIWETEHLEISLYTGINSPKSTYDTKSKSYIHYFNSDPFRTIDYAEGEKPCKSYSYISYTLKDETRKKLGLDKNKL